MGYQLVAVTPPGPQCLRLSAQASRHPVAMVRASQRTGLTIKSLLDVGASLKRVSQRPTNSRKGVVRRGEAAALLSPVPTSTASPSSSRMTNDTMPDDGK